MGEEGEKQEAGGARRSHICASPCTYLEPSRPHSPQIVFILRLEHLDNVRRQRLVPSFLYMYTTLFVHAEWGSVRRIQAFEARMRAHLGLLPRHGEVELILVPGPRLLPESVDSVLFRVVVSCTEDVVLVFLENAQPRSVGELGTLLVGASVQRVLKRRHAGADGHRTGAVMQSSVEWKFEPKDFNRLTCAKRLTTFHDRRAEAPFSRCL